MSALVNVGDVLADKYRVEKVLGVGGMGMVVAAMHIELEERVALKFMLPAAMRSAQAVDRFLREAKSAVKLRSEHVCRVLDVGKLANGAPYIVMEYMQGQDFGELISLRGPLPVIDAVDYMLQAIEGVAEAHANKIVHRDLKPGNLFVTTDSDGSPLVKVLDFGISKSSVAGAATKTGDIMGSPSYMSPEQMMSSKDVDGRADVWALGVILYQAVTGQLPFDAESLPVLCMAVMHDQPRAPAELRPDLPPALNAIIMRCLDKRLDHRFPDVAALGTALASFGGADASSTAARIRKMLNRASSPAIVVASNVAPTLMSTSNGPGVVAPTEMPSMLHPPPQFGRVSTLQASAGSLEVSAVTTPRNRRGMILAGVGAAVGVALVIALIATRDTGTTTRVTPASSATSTTETLPQQVPPATSVVSEPVASPTKIGIPPSTAVVGNDTSSAETPVAAPSPPATANTPTTPPRKTNNPTRILVRAGRGSATESKVAKPGSGSAHVEKNKAATPVETHAEPAKGPTKRVDRGD